MSRIMKNLLMMAAAMAAVSCEEEHFTRHPKVDGMSFNPNYKPKKMVQELREFVIKGTKVMAYSRKDVIKRLKHR